MRFQVVASDFDGTLADDGRVESNTLAALTTLRETGRKLILITGRELRSVREVFPELHRFDLVVAENGALLYRPSSAEEHPLCQLPPARFLEGLHNLGVNPISIGRGIIATVRPHDATVQQVIRELGLDLQIIFNREAVMILPSGTNKGTGLTAALAELGVPCPAVVGIGDAENDHAFLRLCGFSVAVANALPSLKEQVHLVTAGDSGAGVREVLQKLIATGNLP